MNPWMTENLPLIIGKVEAMAWDASSLLDEAQMGKLDGTITSVGLSVSTTVQRQMPPVSQRSDGCWWKHTKHPPQHSDTEKCVGCRVNRLSRSSANPATFCSFTDTFPFQTHAAVSHSYSVQEDRLPSYSHPLPTRRLYLQKMNSFW